MLKTIPFPPKARPAWLRDFRGIRPMDGMLVSLTPNEPVQAKSASVSICGSRARSLRDRGGFLANERVAHLRIAKVFIFATGDHATIRCRS